ncbi:MAG: hypothetical protein KKB95_08895 [Gammaproteobacteria bacterium]|nr:hypothetical protein [Gammaproteobacteria bacterium]MBU1507614.1 hypothetical protein [Gammaproteobacteria bacterium]MBU2119339.1 hypothetical protein [Gammaproteobacteria bacterium]MBU2172389.1 hypothetical protein [Gammaproteobacteria bacterium]MBU2200086.1 hypothetical protein [Gammaproteobacteria bacterium]
MTHTLYSLPHPHCCIEERLSSRTVSNGSVAADVSPHLSDGKARSGKPHEPLG